MSHQPSIPPDPTDTSSEAPAAPTEGRSFPCEGCGADLVFHIGVQNLKCPYCGFVKTLTRDPEKHIQEQDYLATLEHIAGLRDQNCAQEKEFREIHCTSCGATVQFQKNLGSSECVYCGGPLQPADAYEAKHRIGVDGVLPFLIDRQTATQNLREWVQSRWFAPNEFKKRGVSGKFSGVYTPYWTFDALTHTYYSGQRGEYYYVTVGSGKNRRRVRRTRWYPASGQFERFFDDVLVVASTGLPNEWVQKLEPWPLTKCLPFNPQLLAGFVARTYEVELGQGFQVAQSIMAVEIEQDVRSHIGGDTQRIDRIDTSHNAITFKHLLLPIWMLAYKYRDKSYQVVINAGTGEVHGDRPYSWIKIMFTALAAIAVGCGIAWVAANR